MTFRVGDSKRCTMAIRVGITLFALIVCCSLNASADEMLSCYKGDKDKKIFVGEISGANFLNAVDECNRMFADCNGECFGCHVDESSSTEVCVDSRGNTFTP